MTTIALQPRPRRFWLLAVVSIAVAFAAWLAPWLVYALIKRLGLGEGAAHVVDYIALFAPPLIWTALIVYGFVVHGWRTLFLLPAAPLAYAWLILLGGCGLNRAFCL
ncbi:hypothetical protein sos41_29660 [Alphaproteobacteria bacterium SO-S41]|nr:hypothetical protein sos41_29660 [Alphaproteobacteria bacterium SO-S41]